MSTWYGQAKTIRLKHNKTTMYIEVALTSDIINQCLALHYYNQPAGKKLKQRLLWIPTILIVIAVALIIDESRRPEPGSNFFMAFLYIGIAISYYFFIRFRMIKGGTRMLKQLGGNANFTIHIQGDQLVTTTPFDTVTLSWQDFTGALISPKNVLLYQANNTFTMLHQSFFEPGDFEKFKELVRANVSPVKEVAT